MQRKVSKRQLDKARLILTNCIPMSKYLSEVLHTRLDESGKICCPVHDENTPSFFYDDNKKRGNCFGCHVGGTVVEIHLHIMRKQNPKYSYVRAITELAQKYNVQIPDIYTNEVTTQDDRLKKSNRERFSSGDDTYYMEKLKEVTKASLNAELEQRIRLASTIDDVFLGRLTAKEGYLQCRNIMQKQVRV